jgi:signal peptidase II
VPFSSTTAALPVQSPEFSLAPLAGAIETSRSGRSSLAPGIGDNKGYENERYFSGYSAVWLPCDGFWGFPGTSVITFKATHPVGARRVFLILSIVTMCIIADQGTKLLARLVLSDTLPVILFGGTIRLQLVTNGGGVWSAGESLSHGLRSWLFLMGTSIVLVGLFVFALYSRSGRFAEVLAASLLLGGGAGNFIDRLAYGGRILDFISAGRGLYRAGIFNVADMLIIVAFVLMVAVKLGNRREGAARDGRLGSRL